MIHYRESGTKGKYRVESLTRDNGDYQILVEFGDKRNSAMKFSAWCHMFFPHFGVVTDSATGKIEYTFGSKIFFEKFKEVTS